MKKQNIILINSSDISKHFGIGTYVKNLREELLNYSYINLICVEVEFANFGRVLVSENKYTSIHITLKKSYENADVPSAFSSIIFHTILINTKIKDGIFHLNVPTDLELAQIAKENNFKVILTQHLQLHDDSLQQYLKDLTKALYSHLDGCIFLSEHTKEEAEKYLNFPNEKSIVIYNGVNCVRNKSSNAQIRKKLGFLRNDFIAIFVGRLEKSKGLFELIEAFKMFSQKNQKKKLIIIGKGKFDEILQTTNASISNFFFTGLLSTEELADFYKIADIGILPSYSEQSSLSVIEMIHNNIPLILSDIDGFRVFQNHEVIKSPLDISNSSTTINIEKLSENIQLLYENKNIRKELVKNTAHYKKKIMNIKYSTAQTVNFYKKINKGDKKDLY